MHAQLEAFLNFAPPTKISSTDAGALFKHVADCEECAAALGEAPAHAAALIEASQNAEDGELDEEERKLLLEEQKILSADIKEVLGFAKALDRALKGRPLADLEKPLGEDEEGEPFPSTLSAREHRLALAVSEATLVLLSLMSEHGDVSILLDEGETFGCLRAGPEGGNRLDIPATYVAERLGTHAGVSRATAQAIWFTLVNLVAVEKIGLPHNIWAVEQNAQDGDAGETSFPYARRLAVSDAANGPN